MLLYLATTNKNKIKEIKDFIHLKLKSFSELDITDLKSIPNYQNPEETGFSFKENASVKSQNLWNYLKNKKKPVFFGILAEDSGLEVEALHGEPGIYSSRYAGVTANDKKNNELLLEKLKYQKNRKARYVCALSFLFLKEGKKTEMIFETYYEGQIAYQEKGQEGFAYDVLFIPKNSQKTFGQLPFEFKQEVSHRSLALRKWKKYLESIYRK